MTVGGLIKHYASHYPANDEERFGEGTRELSLEQISAISGVPRSTVARWAANKPDFSIFVRMTALIAALGIPEDEFEAAVLPLGED